jgi:hypothetical protein
MITNTGQSILAKYLVGQAPAYASYIAIGCGAKPVSSSHQFSSNEMTALREKTSLDFEMFRIPVTSRGYVVEDGVSKIVFTGELPTLERYKITEVGLFSAASNPGANFNDSRNVLLFNQDEGWQHNNQDQPLSLSPVPERLDSNRDGKISITEKVFIANADNITFGDADRTGRYEGARFLNSLIALRGDLSKIIVNDSGDLSVEDGFAEHLRLTGATLDFDKSSPKDELRLAFSVINKDSESQKQPYDVKILLEFSDKDVFIETDREYARFETVLSSEISPGVPNPDIDFASQRYFVSTAKFEELKRSSGFTWKIANVVKVYVTIQEKDPVTENVFTSDQYYVALDALRLENTQNENPIYGLTGYSIIKTLDSQPVLKVANTSNHIEFRFGLGVF